MRPGQLEQPQLLCERMLHSLTQQGRKATKKDATSNSCGGRKSPVWRTFAVEPAPTRQTLVGAGLTQYCSLCTVGAVPPRFLPRRAIAVKPLPRINRRVKRTVLGLDPARALSPAQSGLSPTASSRATREAHPPSPPHHARAQCVRRASRIRAPPPRSHTPDWPHAAGQSTCQAWPS